MALDIDFLAATQALDRIRMTVRKTDHGKRKKIANCILKLEKKLNKKIQKGK